MTPKDRKDLIRRFTESMATLTPPFIPYAGKSKYVFPLSYYFVCETAKDRLAVIVLQIHSKSYRSEFTIEFGWSRLGRLPEVLSTPYLLEDIAAARRHYSDPEYMNRVRMFFGEMTWWKFSSENPTEAEVSLMAATQVIRDKVIPFVMGALQLPATADGK